MVAVSDISIASISAVSSRKRSSHTGAATTTKRGTAYFIRHGESTFNERNIFAGVVDAELTAFGKMQARQAGQDIQKKSVTFDAVYV
ncbi:MAG: phosphoglycerate mutase family protein, partial [Cyanobacteria bacterium J06576_12]